MPGFRIAGNNGSFTDEWISSGDTPLFGDFINTISTVGGTILSANVLDNGYLVRSGGQTAAFTDTLDNSTNIFYTLSGGTNYNQANVGPGSTFKLRILNTVATYGQTIALGTGLTQGFGTFTILSGQWREFLFTILCAQTPLTLNSNTTSGSSTVSFVLPTGQSALPIGNGVLANNIMPGCSVSGSGISAGTTVSGLILGQGGITGVTLSANATATASNVALSFLPSIKVDSIGGGSN